MLGVLRNQCAVPGGASRLTAFLTFHDVVDDDNDPRHGANSVQHTPQAVSNIDHGDPLVVRDIALARALLRASRAVLRVRQRDFLRHFR